MRDVIRSLLDLQEVDRDLHRVLEELKRLPAERTTRQAELSRQAATVADKRLAAKNLRVRIKEFEDQATAGRQRIRKLENDLSGARADAQLHAFYEHQIKSLKKEIGGAEDQGLELLEQVEKAEREAAEIQVRLDSEQKVFDLFAANVAREIAAAESRRDKLAAERATRMKGDIPREVLVDYERLLRSRDGLALAQLDGRQCQACFMDMPTNMTVRVARGSELVRCPSCDRILYTAL
jgi:predicted  nucleic acid-binding Zn-ribbon protein